jgi:hypothetical protein
VTVLKNPVMRAAPPGLQLDPDSFGSGEPSALTTPGEIAASPSSRGPLLKLALVAFAALLIRLSPLLRGSIDFAFPAKVAPSATGQTIPGAAPWRYLRIHNDSFEYLQLADGLSHGCGFARLIMGQCQAPEILRTPGYPLFLAVVGGVRRALVLQAILGALGCLLLALWINSRWGFRAALAAELLVALDLPSLVLTNQVMSDSLFTALVLLATIPPLLANERPRSALPIALVSGLAAGFAVLVRPIGLILPLFLPIPFFFMRDTSRTRAAALASLPLVLAAIIVFGWCARNYKVAAYPGLSTIDSINLYFYRAGDIVARERGQSLEATRRQLENELGASFATVYEAQSPDLSRRLSALGLRILLNHPLQAAAMTLQGTIYLALFPIHFQLANVLGIPGGTRDLGLNAGAPSIGRVRATIAQTMESPLLAMLVVLQLANDDDRLGWSRPRAAAMPDCVDRISTMDLLPDRALHRDARACRRRRS